MKRFFKIRILKIGLYNNFVSADGNQIFFFYVFTSIIFKKKKSWNLILMSLR